MANKIIIQGDIVLKAIEETQAMLISGSSNKSEVEIEFRNINKWDISGIRLMCAFKKYCLLMDKKLSFSMSQLGDKRKAEELMDILNNYTL